MPELNNELCIGCGKCALVCPFDVFKVSGGKSSADNAKCINCGMCFSQCPVGAIKMPEKMEKSDDEKVKLIGIWADAYAKKHGFRLNPDSETSDLVLRGLIANEKKRKLRYCPCRVGDKRENICPCAFHLAEVRDDGQCHCNLFVK